MAGRVGDYVVAGTGSRALQNADKDTRTRAVEATRNAIQEVAATIGDRLVVMSGMARGFDHLLARTAVEAGVRLWAAVPNRGYAGHYWRDWPTEWERLIGAACQVTYVMEDIHRTSDLRMDGLHANHWRNLFMVDRADEFLAWDPRPGSGTEHCVKAAARAGVPWRDLAKGVGAATLL